ncbi:hypothetical protein [Paraglaciecola sp.]|uniref:hypothetical protein n=1 Tax=Paraglaciecola sp. TaxID=1920173 RepID=UPI0030F37C91
MACYSRIARRECILTKVSRNFTTVTKVCLLNLFILSQELNQFWPISDIIQQNNGKLSSSIPMPFDNGINKNWRGARA